MKLKRGLIEMQNFYTLYNSLSLFNIYEDIDKKVKIWFTAASTICTFIYMCECVLKKNYKNAEKYIYKTISEEIYSLKILRVKYKFSRKQCAKLLLIHHSSTHHSKG